MSRLPAVVRGWRGLAGQRLLLRGGSVPLGSVSPGAAVLPGVVVGWEGCGVTGGVYPKVPLCGK